MKHRNTSSLFSPLAFIVAVLLMSSCDVEFSPNASWKEVPVVYCLLDQDDDTSWVRVEKCYLSDGDIYSPARISDSINYPEGSIQVSLIVFDTLGNRIDSIPFSYTTRNHFAGNFANEEQPLYYSVAPLDSTRRYQLRVRHTSDGELIAMSADTIPLICQVKSTIIRKPSVTYMPDGTPRGQFAFYDPHSTCSIEWDTLRFGRRYQPVVRFYYSVDGDTSYVDLHAPYTVSKGTTPTLSVKYSRYAFLADLKSKLQNDPSTKKYLKMVDLYLTVSSEDYNAYVSSLNAGTSISQGREPYTNIEGGLGVFASRRTHLYKWMPADSSNKAEGLYTHLRDLGVGIE
jgi:hypothetical protein